MRTFPICILAAAGLALAACGSSGGGPSEPDPDPDPGTGTQVQAVTANAIRTYRSQQSSSVQPGTLSTPLSDSAVRHAGYQALRGSPRYFQTDTGLIDGLADTAAPLYTGVGNYDRAVAAYTAFNNANGTRISAPVAVDTRLPASGSTATGAALVDELWRGVYGRLPLMRQDFDRIGYGDRQHAIAAFPAAGIPATGNPMATLDVARTGNVPRTIAGWPTRVAAAQPGSYDPAKDSPPMASLTGKGILGMPVHYIHPSNAAWGTFGKADLTPGTISPIDGSFTPSGPAVPCYIVAASGAGGSAGTMVIDSSLRAGEVFIVPKAALTAGGWQWSLRVAIGGETVDLQRSFTVY